MLQEAFICRREPGRLASDWGQDKRISMGRDGLLEDFVLFPNIINDFRPPAQLLCLELPDVKAKAYPTQHPVS